MHLTLLGAKLDGLHTVLEYVFDNLDALRDAINLKGKGNVVTDALSRRRAQPAQGLPDCLRNIPRVFAPPWGEVWRAWDAGRGEVPPLAPLAVGPGRSRALRESC